MPAQRSRAHSLRWPSPWKGPASRSFLIAPGQGRVRHRADRPRPPPPAAIRAAVAVDGRPRDAPQARDPLDPVRLGGGGRGFAGRRLGFLRGKGAPGPNRPALAPPSPVSLVHPPTLPLY